MEDGPHLPRRFQHISVGLVDAAQGLKRHHLLLCLRLSEGLRLASGDIGSAMMVRVRLGKGGADRYVPLPRADPSRSCVRTGLGYLGVHQAPPSANGSDSAHGRWWTLADDKGR